MINEFVFLKNSLKKIGLEKKYTKKVLYLIILGLDILSYIIFIIKNIILNIKLKGDIYNIFRIDNYLMYLDINARGIHQDLKVYRKREIYSYSFFKNIIKDDSIIVDIGANIGYYALLESIHAKNGKIYAIEPVLKNYNILLKNIYINKINNIIPINIGISDKNEFKQIYEYECCNLSSFIKLNNKKIVSEKLIETKNLDDFIYLYNICPNIIRMDVEGYEYEIFEGAKKFLKNCKNITIFIELHPKILGINKYLEILNLLKQNGFKILAIFNEPPPLRLPLLNLYLYFYKYSKYNYGKIEGGFDRLFKMADLDYFELFITK
ncbi:MAG: FkbM family methyltransferase [Methanomassiliicoccales archaeon]